MKHPIAGFSPLELAAALEIKPFQARQILRWIHQKQVFDFEAMTDLPKALRERLAQEYTALHVQPAEIQRCERTGTKKILFRLHDGETVESVLLRDGQRVTLCLSSQAGCPLKCAFCATGQAGFSRNLSRAEIVEQALYLLQEEDLGGRTPNVVYMGMGEPFYNLDAVLPSIRLLMDPNGLGIGARKITVSTAGEVKGIARFAQEDWQVRLSVSLHAADNEKRSRLVPLNRKYPLERLHAALKNYQRKTTRQFTFEWTLLDGVNDAPEDAKALAAYAKGLYVSVNLIPWNPVPGMDFRPSPKNRREAFLSRLKEEGLQATLRQERGQDIEAACGQLRRTHGTQ